MIKKIVTNILLLATLHTILYAQEINIDALAKKAVNENKHLFVWLHKTGCGYCENMKEFTLQNDVIKAYIKEHFIYQHINVSQGDDVIYKGLKKKARVFAKSLGYDFYPSSLFFDKDANLIFADVGFMDGEILTHEQKFYKILHFIDSNFYKKMDFDEYKFEFDKEL